MSESHVEIDYTSLQRSTVDSLIEEFATRDGTDYGLTETSLDQKKRSLWNQLETGNIAIVYDSETETANLVLRQELLTQIRERQDT